MTLRAALIGLALALGLAGPLSAQGAADGLRGAAPAPSAGASASIWGVDPAAPAKSTRLTGPVVSAPTKPFVPPVRLRDPALASPSLATPPLMSPIAPRITGRSEGGGGGSACRLACARDNYSCLAQDGGDCSATWIKCMSACPERSSGVL